MTTAALDTVTVSGPDDLSGRPLSASTLEDIHADVFSDSPRATEDVVDDTLAALERHLSWVTLPDVLELRVLVESDAIDLETAFVDTLEQVLDHLASWQ